MEFVNSMDLLHYKSNELVKSAVERRFINIGEALNRLKQIDVETFNSIPDGQRVIGFRNILVHGYESVSDELVWEIVNERILPLRNTCEQLLK
jgi:uncharacterized protein with HEPN domain